MPTRGRIQVSPGQVIQSAQWGNVVWDQSVNAFANAADRTAQWPNPQEGALSYLADLRRWYGYTAGAWTPIGVALSVAGQVDYTGAPIPVGSVLRTVAGRGGGVFNAAGQTSLAVPGGFPTAMVAVVTSAVYYAGIPDRLAIPSPRDKDSFYVSLVQNGAPAGNVSASFSYIAQGY